MLGECFTPGHSHNPTQPYLHFFLQCPSCASLRPAYSFPAVPLLSARVVSDQKIPKFFVSHMEVSKQNAGVL
jgi:hypothetical protein